LVCSFEKQFRFCELALAILFYFIFKKKTLLSARSLKLDRCTQAGAKKKTA
jgi:hypothetical protein